MGALPFVVVPTLASHTSWWRLSEWQGVDLTLAVRALVPFT